MAEQGAAYGHPTPSASSRVPTSKRELFDQTFPSMPNRSVVSTDKNMSASRGTVSLDQKVDVYARPRIPPVLGAHMRNPEKLLDDRMDLKQIRHEFRKNPDADTFPEDLPYSDHMFTALKPTPMPAFVKRKNKNIWEEIDNARAKKRTSSLQTRYSKIDNANTVDSRSQFDTTTGMKLKMSKMTKDLTQIQDRHGVAKGIFHSIDYRGNEEEVFAKFDAEILEVRNEVGSMITTAREEMRDIFAEGSVDSKLMIEDLNEVEWESTEMRKVVDRMEEYIVGFEKTMGKNTIT